MFNSSTILLLVLIELCYLSFGLKLGHHEVAAVDGLLVPDHGHRGGRLLGRSSAGKRFMIHVS